MLMRRLALSAFLLGACSPSTRASESPPARSVASSATEPAPTAPTSAPQATTPAATATASRPDAGVPALSSPNASATAKSGAGSNDESLDPKDDPRTAAIRRVAVAARSCYTKHVAGAKGKLMLRIALGDDGHVSNASVVLAESSAALQAEPFQKCVLEAARREKFPPPKTDDEELELPLTFAPAQ